MPILPPQQQLPIVPPQQIPILQRAPPSQHDNKVNEKLRAAGLEQKVTNVWVGKICTLVEDSVIKNLLLVYSYLKKLVN